MPLFEYICKSCSLKFEQLVTGALTPSCPSCQSRALEKQISVFAVGGRGDGTSGDATSGSADGDFDGLSSDGPGACGTCGDPRGPGSCDSD